MTGDAECSMFACHESMVAIWHDTAAETEKKLSLVIARLDRLTEEESKARAEKVHLQTLRDYQAAHPLLAQPRLDEAVE